jgi:hypothetical protein
LRRLFWFENEMEGNGFITQMGSRLEQAGVKVVWNLAGI